MSALDTSRTEWDLNLLFSSDTDPAMEKDKERVKKANYAFIDKWKDREDYLQDPEVLFTVLQEFEVLEQDVGSDGNLGYYYALRESQDQNDKKVKAQANKIEEFERKINNDIQFFEHRLARVDEEHQKKFLADEKLQRYKHFLERLFEEAKYLLSEPEEKIMNLKSSASYGQWVDMTNRFVSKETRELLGEDGKKKERNFSEILSLLNHPKKEIRNSAAEGFNDILAQHAEVAEAEINAILSDKKVNDELRNFSRPDTSRHVADDIASSTVDMLVEVVVANYELAQKYYQLKAKLFGVKKLAYHERNLDYGDLNKKYNYKDSVNLVHKVFKKLDQEFADILQMFVEKGHVDVLPKKGKRSGAFCIHHLLSQPTYILLNHTERLNDVLTIAHEAGHGINNELVRKKQHALDFGTSLATAEVASTFFEDFVLDELLEEADEELQLALLMMKLNGDISSIFRQIACYVFQQKLHAHYREHGYVSKEEIGKIFQETMKAYMGPAVEQSLGAENWWVYWSHIRSFFYVYSYANGLLISKSLQQQVKEDPKFIEKVKVFLSSGLSSTPEAIFKGCGIDITSKAFWEKGIQEVEDLLIRTEKLAKKLGKI